MRTPTPWTVVLLSLLSLFASCQQQDPADDDDTGDDDTADDDTDDDDSGDDDTAEYHYIKPDGTYHSPDGAAWLEVSGNVRVLALSGSHQQLGYNHGYLLAGEIIEVLNHYVMWTAGENYEALLADIEAVEWGSDNLVELEALVQGMKDALREEDRLVEPVGLAPHEVTVEDVMLFNTLSEWAFLYECSSFSVWGPGRADGSTLFARNFDYFLDPQEKVRDFQVITSYSPDQGPRWLNVGVAGITGCFSCINEHGVIAMTHVSHGNDPSEWEGFVPRVYALRRVMEAVDGTGAPAAAEAILEQQHAYKGSNYHISGRALGQAANDDVAAIIEQDGDATQADGRATWRKPSHNPSLAYDHDLAHDHAILTTNHFVLRHLDVPYEPGGTTIDRYLDMKSGLAVAAADGDVDLDEAEEIMRAVGKESTIHTTIFEPDSMLLHIYLSETGAGAFDGLRHDLTFDELFFSAGR